MTSVNRLPAGWESCSLGDLVKIIRGVSYAKEQSSTEPKSGFVPIIRATNINAVLDFEELVYVDPKCVSEEQMLRPGDLVVAASSGSKSVVGKAGHFAGGWKGSFGAFCMGLRPTAEVESRYIGFFLQTDEYRHRVSELSSGSNINNLKRDHIQSFPFRLAPRNEQRRIVAKLEELFSDLDAGVAALERAKANLKRYRASVLKAAVEGELTKEWRAEHPNTEPASKLLARILTERRQKWEADQLAKFAANKKEPPKGWKEKYVEPSPPDLADLPTLPKGWRWATVDQTSEVQGGIQKQPKRRPTNNSFPFLRVANVHRNRLALDEVHRIELFGDELERLRLEPDDLLVVEGNGSKTEIGRSAIWSGEIEDCVHQNHIIRVRFLAGSSRFLNACWNSPSGNARVMEQAASTSGLYTLSVAKVCNLPLPLAPSAEQELIVSEVESRLSNAVAAETAIDLDLSRASLLRQSILREAFQGRLVPQDPMDESAPESLAQFNRLTESIPVRRREGDKLKQHQDLQQLPNGTVERQRTQEMKKRIGSTSNGKRPKR